MTSKAILPAIVVLLFPAWAFPQSADNANPTGSRLVYAADAELGNKVWSVGESINLSVDMHSSSTRDWFKGLTVRVFRGPRSILAATNQTPDKPLWECNSYVTLLYTPESLNVTRVTGGYHVDLALGVHPTKEWLDDYDSATDYVIVFERSSQKHANWLRETTKIRKRDTFDYFTKYGVPIKVVKAQVSIAGIGLPGFLAGVEKPKPPLPGPSPGPGSCQSLEKVGEKEGEDIRLAITYMIAESCTDPARPTLDASASTGLTFRKPSSIFSLLPWLRRRL